MSGPGYGTMMRDIEQSAREAFDDVVAALPDDVRTEALFVAGDPARELAAQSESVDLLFAPTTEASA
jgi:hypothetical protein